MRHRIIGNIHIGLGNPEKEKLNNKGRKPPRDFCEDALKKYFAKVDWFDFSRGKDFLNIGLEPAYQYEKLKIISIHKNKEKSFIETGYARGGYGSQICRSRKTYKDYCYKSKFVKFIDAWHPILFRKASKRKLKGSK